MEPEDVPGLPWWKRKLYVEGLLWEFADQNDEPVEYRDATSDNLTDMGFTTNSHAL